MIFVHVCLVQIATFTVKQHSNLMIGEILIFSWLHRGKKNPSNSFIPLFPATPTTHKVCRPSLYISAEGTGVLEALLIWHLESQCACLWSVAACDMALPAIFVLYVVYCRKVFPDFILRWRPKFITWPTLPHREGLRGFLCLTGYHSFSFSAMFQFSKT